MSHPLVACVVLNWNGGEIVLECLHSLSELDYPNLEIIVSDNGSTDGSIEAIRDLHPQVTLLENGRNLQFAGGNNVGIEYALERDADYILLINNDTVSDPRLVSELVEVGETDERIGLLGPKIYYHSDPALIWYAGGRVSLWRGLVKHRGIREPDRGRYDDVEDTGYITGCALMMKREVPEQIGLLDPSYVAYAEDTDLSLRAAKAGFRLVYVPSAVLWHRIGASWGVVTGRKIFRKLRSQAILLRRHAPPWAWFTTIPLFFVLDGIRILWLIVTGRVKG